VSVTPVTADPDVARREVSLELIGLSRRFGSVVALEGLTFSVPPGEVFGFLGPNEAGTPVTELRRSLSVGDDRYAATHKGHQCQEGVRT
jgi:ABC-type uncharacterized transport system ATPase subunit